MRLRAHRFPVSIQRVALRKLFMLHGAKELQDLRISPANRLERLLIADYGDTHCYASLQRYGNARGLITINILPFLKNDEIAYLFDK